MRRTRLVLGLATMAAVSLLAMQCAVAAERSKGRPDARQWDEPAPSANDVAMADDPPGPPPEGDDDRPPPPRRPDGDRRGPDRDFGPPGRGPHGEHPMGPPPDRDFDGPGPGHDRGPGAERRPPRDGVRDRMPPRREGGRDGDQPPGPPRGPHDRQGMMEKADPEMAKLVKEDRELDRKTHELVMKYRRATSEERDGLKKQLEETVNKHFDVRQQRRELEVKRLEKELQRLREAVERRTKSRKELVDRRVSELLDRVDEARF